MSAGDDDALDFLIQDLESVLNEHVDGKPSVNEERNRQLLMDMTAKLSELKVINRNRKIVKVTMPKLKALIELMEGGSGSSDGSAAGNGLRVAPLPPPALQVAPPPALQVAPPPALQVAPPPAVEVAPPPPPALQVAPPPPPAVEVSPQPPSALQVAPPPPGGSGSGSGSSASPLTFRRATVASKMRMRARVVLSDSSSSGSGGTSSGTSSSGAGTSSSGALGLGRLGTKRVVAPERKKKGFTLKDADRIFKK